VVRARNRNDRDPSLPGAEKTRKWPRTSRRQQRIESVLQRRQTSLTVVLEDVHDPHNARAVLRSCDAAGVLDVHLVYVHEEFP
jgi:tRNA (guanosine-2'-O-)-methyltransferase